jgi:hypothetical protein
MDDLNKDRLLISSKKKWFWVGFAIALINPVFAGLLISAAFLSEPALKKSGFFLAAFSIAWGAFTIYFINNLNSVLLSGF